MLNNKQKESLRTLYSKFGENQEGFMERNAQKQMMASITASLSKVYEGDDRPDGYKTPIAVIEGSTGTGKTVAYLLGSLPLALAEKTSKTIIISTATIALQEQLAHTDLPKVAKHSGLDFKAVIAKGRRRYCCVNRLSSIADDGTADMFGTDQSAPESDEYKALFTSLNGAFNNGSWDGDSDSWDTQIPFQAWDKISTDALGCSGGSCSSYDSCPFFKARKELHNADIIVANHDLVLSALNVDSDILPSPEKCIYIADESHHLPLKALSHNGASHQLGSTIEWLEQAIKAIDVSLTMLPKLNMPDYTIKEPATRLVETLKEFRIMVSTIPDLAHPEKKQRSNPVWRFKHGIIPDEIRPIADNAIAASKDTVIRLTLFKDKVKEMVDANTISTDLAESILLELSVYLGRSQTILETWELMARKDTSRQPPMARWIELIVKANSIDYMVAANAITVDTFLDELMWSRFAGVVLTSATLSSLGTFKRFAEQCGLQYQDDVTYKKLASPFDFQKNAVLEIPSLKSLPSDDGHTDEITQWMNDNINLKSGTLVLFSSYWQMNQVRRNIDDKVGRLILMQNDMSKQALLRTHKENIDNGYGSVLFGVASLSEGVDLVGKYLSHVIITKIPFSVPDSPIYNATSEWLEANKRNPFAELSIPDASLKLIQGVGRLIRSETDTGKVSILDSRLLSKKYGQKMIEDLPPMKQLFDN